MHSKVRIRGFLQITSGVISLFTTGDSQVYSLVLVVVSYIIAKMPEALEFLVFVPDFTLLI